MIMSELGTNIIQQLDPITEVPPSEGEGSPPWSGEEFAGFKQVHLWHFLLEMLANPDYDDIISWSGEYGEFVIKDPNNVARLWGKRKQKPKMNYEKLSRALRYYYSKRILHKCEGKRYAYQFNVEALRVILQRSADRKPKESIETQTEAELSEEQEEMLDEKPYTNPFIHQLAVLTASEGDAAAKRRQEPAMNPIRPIPVIPGGFPFPPPSFEKSSKNLLLHPGTFNPFSIGPGGVPPRMSALDAMNARNLHALHGTRQPHHSWSSEGPGRAQAQLYEAMFRQIQVAMDKQGEQPIVDKDLLAQAYHKKIIEQQQNLLRHKVHSASLPHYIDTPFALTPPVHRRPESPSKHGRIHRHGKLDVDDEAFIRYRGNQSPFSGGATAGGQRRGRDDAEMFTFGQADIEAYQADLVQKPSRQLGRQTRCISEITTMRKDRTGKGLIPDEPRSAFPSSKQDVRMVELRRPTMEELRNTYKNPKAHPVKPASSPKIRYIELTRPEHHHDIGRRLGSTGRSPATSPYASASSSPYTASTSPFATSSSPYNTSSFPYATSSSPYATSPRHSEKSRKEKPSLRRQPNVEARSRQKEESEQTEPLNLSCPKIKHERDASPSFRSNFLHVPTDSPGRFSKLSPPSPLRPSSIGSPSTPYSPMRNLRISDPSSPAPASPSRKRQIKMSLSSNDLPQSSTVEEKIEVDDPNKAKLGRFTCKDAHVKRRLGSSKQFSLDGWWQQPPDRFTHLNPDHLGSVSASLPSSPNHVMPPKWRFKHRKQGDTGSSSEPLTPEIKRSPIGKRHSDVMNYANKFTVTHSRDNTIEAYQNDEELILVSNDVTAEDDDVMETSYDLPNIVEPRRRLKIFRTPSEEVRDITEGRLRDHEVTVGKPSMPPPIIRVHSPSQQETSSDVEGLSKTSEVSFQKEKTNDATMSDCDDVIDEASGLMMPYDRVLPKPVARRKQDSKTDEWSKISRTKKSGSLRAVSGNFIKAILSSRDKAHSCPPAPTSGRCNELVSPSR